MKDGVLLLHGLARTARSMCRLEGAARAAGYATCNLDYPSRRLDIGALADHLHKTVAAFADRLDGRLHILTHSMGGLVARALIHSHRPARLGRMVMLAPPNQGSEIADLLVSTRAYRRAFGPAGAQLGTGQPLQFGPVDFELGIIAGDRAFDPLGWIVLPKPNDGKVSVAATRLAGMADHLVVPATHTFVMRHPAAIVACLDFLARGRFGRRSAVTAFH